MASPGEASGGGGKGGGTGSATSIVTDQICAAVKSTSNLLHLMQLSSPGQVQLAQLPKNLVTKASVIQNTGNVLEKLPQLISSLDTNLEAGLQSVSHLKTVSQLLSNMEKSQLEKISRVHHPFQTDQSTDGSTTGTN